MPRLFIAVKTPAPLVRELVRIQDDVLDRLRILTALPNIKPEKLVNSHCTLRFLGDTGEDRVPDIISEVSKSVHDATIGAFEVSLGACGVFPKRGHARVMWVAL